MKCFSQLIVHNRIVKGAFKNITNHSIGNSIVFVTITKIVIPFESNWILFDTTLSTSIVAHSHHHHHHHHYILRVKLSRIDSFSSIFLELNLTLFSPCFAREILLSTV